MGTRPARRKVADKRPGRISFSDPGLKTRTHVRSSSRSDGEYERSAGKNPKARNGRDASKRCGRGPHYGARQSDRRKDALSGSLAVAAGSSRCAAPALRCAPAGDPPPSTRPSAAMADRLTYVCQRCLGRSGCHPFPFPPTPRRSDGNASGNASCWSLRFAMPRPAARSPNRNRIRPE